jgi:amidohydrolase
MPVKEAVREALEASRERITRLSRRIHGAPELGFEEERAAAWLCEELADAGFDVEAGYCNVPTAFLGRAGSGPLHVAFCAEYDALPGIGHACGHNLIAAMALGAGIAAARVAGEVGLTVSVIGTPAEEVGDAGGKILLLERGAFEGIHAAMMVHPAPYDMLLPGIIAATAFEVRYTGRAAHAAAFPELGVNAADALTVAQTAIGLLRQHLRQTDLVHGVVTHGGDAPSIVPAHTSARYIVRARSLDQLEELRERVLRYFEAGAVATGSKLEVVGGAKPYAPMRHDARLAQLYRRSAEALGRSFRDLDAAQTRMAGSTDMGNLSIAVPSIHPMIGIDSLPAVNHQPEFTEHCVSAAAERALFDGALAMAWTAVDLAAEASSGEGPSAPR